MKRRQWTIAEKRRVVEESLQTGVRVGDVARRYGVHSNQVYAWRRAAREGVLDDKAGRQKQVGMRRDGTIVVSMNELRERFADDALLCSSLAKSPNGRMEIVVGPGRSVVVDSSVDTVALRRVLDVLRQF